MAQRMFAIPYFVTIVDIWGNSLSGSLPSEIWELSSIRWFYVYNNKLTGSIPEDFGNLSLLNRVFFEGNMFTGSLPDVFHNFTMLQWFDISGNKLSGSIPDSLWNLTTFQRLHLQSNLLTGTVPKNFCSSNINMGKPDVDRTTWFLDKPKVECSCCGNSPSCRLWDIEEDLIGDNKRIPCPSSNIVNIPDIYSEYWATDLLSDATLTDLFGLIFHDADLCLSPTGCYNIEHLIDEKQTKTSYNLSYSSSSQFLAQQDECDAVEICGFSFHRDHPKRTLLNHFTQSVVPDFADFNDSSSSHQSRMDALCWIMVEDPLFDEYEICDGSLLQRYILAFFFISQTNSKYDFNQFSSEPTCEWPGIRCDTNNKFVEHIILPNADLHGTIISEISYLVTLKTIDLSSNSLTGSLITEIGFLLGLQTINVNMNRLTGTINPSLLTPLQKLSVFEVGNNQLGGNIPKELVELPLLRKVNLMNNTLIGTLPTNSYSQNLGKSIHHYFYLKNDFGSISPRAFFLIWE